MQPIPITIVTGFLGSGKTTLILNLIPQLPAQYKLALLKNEFGDVAVDSQLASASAISGVQELLNGCICCNLVGQLSDALETLRTGVSPDRIVIETSGSAFPATLAMEVNRLAQLTGQYVLDGVISVIDVENWKGYDDTSYTAKVQARYTDLIVLNKWELVNERRLEDCEDMILSLELDPPTPRTKSSKGWVDKSLIFGLDAALAKEQLSHQKNEDGHEHEHHHDHQTEVDVLSVTLSCPNGSRGVDLQKLERLLRAAPKDEIYRIKGIIRSRINPGSVGEKEQPGPADENLRQYLLNWAFGRWTFTLAGPSHGSASFSASPKVYNMDGPESGTDDCVVRMTLITAPYESSKWKGRLEEEGFFGLDDGSDGGLQVKRIA